MQLKDLKWDQQIKHVPLEGTTRDMLLAVIGGLVNRISALEQANRLRAAGEVASLKAELRGHKK